ncbi:MAG: RDD family protein [Sphingomonadales bacterium]|nr:RDD family protein [Sphingomonadales bacterium]MBD3772036.1 RDD family protein [Paracoccaceae bacterium]
MSAGTAPWIARQQKRRRDVVTPEGIALPFTVAGRGARFGALLLDFIILYVGMLIFLFLAMYIASGAGELLDDKKMSGPVEMIVVIFFVGMFLARYGYFMFFELGPRGATPGKRVAGIRVAARDGGRLTPSAVLARNLLRDIEIFLPLVFILTAQSGEGGAAAIAATLWFAIFMLFPFFNRDAMRAGDLIAGTWVVEAPKAKLLETITTAEAAAGRSSVADVAYRFSDAELSVYGEYELQTLEKVLRDDIPTAMVNVHEAICRKIGWNPGAGDERAFLEAFYAQLRAKLEGDMRFGKRKKDKFS